MNLNGWDPLAAQASFSDTSIPPLSLLRRTLGGPIANNICRGDIASDIASVGIVAVLLPALLVLIGGQDVSVQYRRMSSIEKASSESEVDCIHRPSSLPDPRRGFVDFITSNIRSGTWVVAKAPTGFGKTRAVLSAACNCQQDSHRRIVYFAKTHQQLKNAGDEFRLLQPKGKLVLLEGYKRSCLHGAGDKFDCRSLVEGKICPGAQNRYCPYRNARVGQASADIVLVPYVYLFKTPLKQNDIVIFDEGHQLANMLQEHNSAVVSGRFLEIVRSHSEGDQHQMGAKWNRLQQELSVMSYVRPIHPGGFLHLCLLRSGFESASMSQVYEFVEKLICWGYDEPPGYPLREGLTALEKLFAKRESSISSGVGVVSVERCFSGGRTLVSETDIVFKYLGGLVEDVCKWPRSQSVVIMSATVEGNGVPSNYQFAFRDFPSLFDNRRLLVRLLDVGLDAGA